MTGSSTPSLPGLFGPSLSLDTLPARDAYESETGGGGGSIPSASMMVQEQSFWCWAAVTQAIKRTLGDADPGQAGIAHAHLDRHRVPHTCWGDEHQSTGSWACNDAGCTANCNDAHMLRGVLGEHGRYQGPIPLPLSERLIADEIRNGRPIACRVVAPAHFILIVGLRVASDGAKYVTFLDPANGDKGTAVKERDVPLKLVEAGTYSGALSIAHAYKVK